MSDDQIREIRDRSRRIETRLTKVVKAMGIEAGETAPVFDPDDQTLTVPNRYVSFHDCLKSIPPKTNVTVMFKDEALGYISKEQ